MNRTRSPAAFAAILLLSFLATGARADIRIGGAGTTLGTMRELAAAYEKTPRASRVMVDSESKASVGGVRALMKGELDIATATRELTEADVEGLSRLRSVEIARVPFVFAVNAATPVKGVSSADLLQIYQRKKTTWEDGSRIILVPRTTKVSDTIFLMELGPEWKKAIIALEADPTIQKIETAQDAADLVEKRRGALTIEPRSARRCVPCSWTVRSPNRAPTATTSLCSS
jgi:phosphate transport system substrate-binding protein